MTGWRPSRPRVVRSTWRQARTASARAVVTTAKQRHSPGAATNSRAVAQPHAPPAKPPCLPAQPPSPPPSRRAASCAREQAAQTRGCAAGGASWGPGRSVRLRVALHHAPRRSQTAGSHTHRLRSRSASALALPPAAGRLPSLRGESSSSCSSSDPLLPALPSLSPAEAAGSANARGTPACCPRFAACRAAARCRAACASVRPPPWGATNPCAAATASPAWSILPRASRQRPLSEQSSTRMVGKKQQWLLHASGTGRRLQAPRETGPAVTHTCALRTPQRGPADASGGSHSSFDTPHGALLASPGTAVGKAIEARPARGLGALRWTFSSATTSKFLNV